MMIDSVIFFIGFLLIGLSVNVAMLYAGNWFLGKNGSNASIPKNNPALSIKPKMTPLTIPTIILL